MSADQFRPPQAPPTPPWFTVVQIGGHQVTLHNGTAVCAYCGLALARKYHVDHIVPRVKGGTNEVANLIASCAKCNISKNDLDLDEYRERVARKSYGMRRRNVADDEEWLNEFSLIAWQLMKLTRAEIPPDVPNDHWGEWLDLCVIARDDFLGKIRDEEVFPFERGLYGPEAETILQKRRDDEDAQ